MVQVQTVRGAMAADAPGTVLIHEHVFVRSPDVLTRGDARTAAPQRRRETAQGQASGKRFSGANPFDDSDGQRA